MNIIKFKDQIRPGDALFNKFLKGKYAYWIQMRYIVPFEFIDSAQYVKFEGDINALIGWRERGCPEPEVRYWDLQGKNSNLEAWVDVDGTESANNIMPFSRHNCFAADEDITLDEVKKFRSWLADALLEFDRTEGGEQKCSFYTEDFTDVLLYYKNGMYNKTVKALSQIPAEFGISKASVNNCGCGAGSDISNLYKGAGTLCDPLYIYRKYIYTEMCHKFADMSFWVDFPSVFILEFKQYIDNIIRLNLPLTKSPYTSVFMDCSCQSNPEQGLNMEILTRLSKALGHIADGEITGNKNYITKALQDWSADLYEQMEWV